MATLVGLIVGAIALLFTGLLGGMVENLFNYIMSDPLTNFKEVLTFIPDLLFTNKEGMDAFNAFYADFAVVGIVITLIVVILSVVKSMMMPAAGKESESPVQIVLRGFLATAAITVYSNLITFFVDSLVIPLAQTEYFMISIPNGTLGAWAAEGIFDAGVLLNIIFYVSILVALITAGITHLERMLSFSLFILLGPICLAFYPASESKGVAGDWAKGVIAQTFGIFISLFAMNLAGKALIMTKDEFTTFNLIVVVALLGFVKNSEKFVNMLGFRTMPNSDTMRGIMTGMGATMVGARMVGGGIMAGGKFTKDTYNKFKTSDTAYMSQGAQRNQKQFLNGATLNATNGSVNNVDNVGKKLADVQIANTKFGDGSELKTMSKRDFDKTFNKMATENGSLTQKFANRKQRAEAYKQYSERINEASAARKKMFDNDSQNISASEYEAATGMTAFNKRMMPNSEMKDVTVSDLEGKNITAAKIGETITENIHNPSELKTDQQLIFSDPRDTSRFAGSYARVSDNKVGDDETKFVGNIGQNLTSYGEMVTGVSLPQSPANEFTGGPKTPSIKTEGNVQYGPRVDEERIRQSGNVKNYEISPKVTSIEYQDGSKISMPTNMVDNLSFRNVDPNAIPTNESVNTANLANSNVSNNSGQSHNNSTNLNNARNQNSGATSQKNTNYNMSKNVFEVDKNSFKGNKKGKNK